MNASADRFEFTPPPTPGLLRAVGLAMAPADAVPEVLAIAHYITKKNGGRGAVREVCDMLLEIQKSRQGSVQQ